MRGRSLLGAVGLVAALLPACSNGTSYHVGEVSSSQREAQAGWAKSYVYTTCREFVSDLSGPQQLAAAYILLNADIGLDNSTGPGDLGGDYHPWSSAVAEFNDRLGEGCARSLTKMVSNVADEVFAADYEHRMQAYGT